MVFQDTEPFELKAVKQGLSFILSVRLCPAHGKEALAPVFEFVYSNIHIQMCDGGSGEVITVSYHCKNSSPTSPAVLLPYQKHLLHTDSSWTFISHFSTLIHSIKSLF